MGKFYFQTNVPSYLEMFFRAKQNPHFTLKVEDHPPHIIIWAGVAVSHVIGLYFVDETIISVSYLEMLRNFVTQEPSNRGIMVVVVSARWCQFPTDWALNPQ